MYLLILIKSCLKHSFILDNDSHLRRHVSYLSTISFHHLENERKLLEIAVHPIHPCDNRRSGLQNGFGPKSVTRMYITVTVICVMLSMWLLDVVVLSILFGHVNCEHNFPNDITDSAHSLLNGIGGGLTVDPRDEVLGEA